MISMQHKIAVLVLAALLFILPGCRVQDGSDGLDLEASYILNPAQGNELSRLLHTRAADRYGLCPESDHFRQRLERLASGHANEEGLALNYAVYATGDVLADVFPDGSLRFSAGFLSMFTDNELRFIIGHLIGQLHSGDSLQSLGAVWAARDLVGVPFYSLTDAQKDAVYDHFARQGYSRGQEEDADDYAYRFLQRYDYDLLASISALQKLDKLDRNIPFVASHIESGSRAERMRRKIDS